MSRLFPTHPPSEAGLRQGAYARALKYPPMIIRRALWRVRNTDDRWHAIRMSRAGAKCSDPSGTSRQGGVRHTPSRRVPPGASNFAEWPVRRSRNLKV